MSQDKLRGSSRVYISIVVTLGLFVVLESLYSLSRAPIDPLWLMLAVLTLLSGSFTVRIPGIPARLSVSETFVFAAALLFGPPAATMTVVLDTLVISFWLGRAATPPWSRLAFNTAAAAVAIWTAARLFYVFAGIEPLAISRAPIVPLLPGLAVLATLYFLLNSWLVAFVVGFEKRRSPISVWRHSFLWLSLNYYSGASIAALILPYLTQAGDSGFMYVFGVILPVLLISYLTFKTALGRIDDATKHLSQLNRLYLSTIETLAMAIDAKDQITHGHIRRVQQYAVGLAKHMGITEPGLISAIEAASLLHDMGKLAVPEYILNKPSRLTPAEFDRMKLHASIGADILSAIDFPYPVVPIVRHHHENWDGTGYPDGLRGTSIPIGARILSVVDCFDALTSDRPYRPKMSDADAVAILLARRGSMYDPIIVDAFVAIHNRILPSGPTVPDVRDVLHRDNSTYSVGVGSALSSFDDIAGSSEETLMLYDLASDLVGRTAVSDVAETISKHVRRIVPASTIILFAHEAHTDEIVSAHVVGTHSPTLSGLRIPRGERLSGWVAANKQTIVNSDPVLDLGEAGRNVKPRLRSCLSTPIGFGQSLVGVLTLYSVEADAFTEEHKRILEVVSKQVSPTVKSALDGERTQAAPVRDRNLELPNARQFEHLFSVVSQKAQPGEKVSIVWIAVTPNEPTPETLERAVEATARAVRRALRGHDLLFRYAQQELVVLLAQTDEGTARLVADRIREAMGELSMGHSVQPSVQAALGVATAPTSRVAVQTLVDSARASGHSGPSSAIH